MMRVTISTSALPPQVFYVTPALQGNLMGAQNLEAITNVCLMSVKFCIPDIFSFLFMLPPGRG